MKKLNKNNGCSKCFNWKKKYNVQSVAHNLIDSLKTITYQYYNIKSDKTTMLNRQSNKSLFDNVKTDQR
uniref:Uncharacterized protein n=1 Tax=Schistosoma mansoni TaxID=6183 RepID=A0A5K4F689_SCHMA